MPLVEFLKIPKVADDKYSRGVLGFITGSEKYPGAALLGVAAAMRTGIGMVRYLGPESVSNLVLQTRPEIVLQDGQAQAWVVGSGVPPNDTDQVKRIIALAKTKTLMVVDAGALQMFDFATCNATCVLTPHAGEMATLLNSLGQVTSRAAVEANPIEAALSASELTGQLVVLKGNQTVVAKAQDYYQFVSAPAVLATAGSGDVLAGIMGALIASNASEILEGTSSLFEVAKAAVELQAMAAALAAKNSTVVALDVADRVGEVIAGITSDQVRGRE